MTVSGAAAPSGSESGGVYGNLLYGTEYQKTGTLDKNHDGDAACAVCEYTKPQKDVYIQWGRQSCSNAHALVYKGLVMGNDYRYRKSTHTCVDWARDLHSESSPKDQNGALLYTTEMEKGSSDESQYPHNWEVGCSACAAGTGRTVFARWGSLQCPSGSALLYTGFMASSKYDHAGGGANTLCMHGSGQAPSGASSSNKNGNLLYGMEYQNTGAIDKNHDQDAACAVCELDRWESVYTQWGRSEACTNGHQTLYKGYIMANKYTQQKGEYVCVDEARAAHSKQSTGDENGGLLYTTEMEQGASDESQYPHNVEVGCSVCAAHKHQNELPFAAQEGNALHGEWVKLRTMHVGQDVTISYGYEASSGTASSTEETKESAITHSWDVSVCFTAGWEAGALFTKASFEVEACAGYGEEKSESVAKTTAKEASWDVTGSQGMEDTFYIPGAPPEGTPDAGTIQAHGVHLWQWQWTILEAPANGNQERWFKGKANSHYLFSPNDPNDHKPKRPCCFPGQEYSLWYPFNCKSTEGLLPGAYGATYCHVGLPADATAHISSMSQQDVAQWLRGLSLSGDYSPQVAEQALDGPALALLAKIVDKSSVASGDDPSDRALWLMADAFSASMGDASHIMAGLLELLARGS